MVHYRGQRLSWAAVGTFILLGLPPVMAQPAQLTIPQMGTVPYGSYSLSDIETIDDVSGNVLIKIPLTSMAPGPAGFSLPIGLTYNSSIYAWSWNGNTNTLVSSDIFDQTNSGGWRYNFNYALTNDYIPFDPGLCNQNNNYAYLRYRLITPDGSSHTLYISGRSDDVTLGYYPYPSTNCAQVRPEPGNVTFYTADGTFLRVDWIGSSQTWSAYFPDGRIVSGTGFVNATSISDKNGNQIQIATAMNGGTPTSYTLEDANGRCVNIQLGVGGSNQDVITQTWYNDLQPQLQWTVNWEEVQLDSSHTYNCDSQFPCPAPGPQWMVSSIGLPNGLLYQFQYGTGDSQWGQLSQMKLPSGAQVNYTFSGPSGPLPGAQIPIFPIASKTVTWLDEDDCSSTCPSRTETSSYQFSTTSSIFTNPDGGVTTHSFYDTSNANPSPFTGLVYQVVQPNGDLDDRVWSPNVPYGTSNNIGSWGPIHVPGNPYVQQEITSLANGGSAAPAAAKVYTYDRNGNQTNVQEWDCTSPPACSINRTSGAASGFSGGTLIRTTANVFLSANGSMNAAGPAIATVSGNTTLDDQAYWNVFSPQLLNLVSQTTVSGTPGAMTQFGYDCGTGPGGLTHGNVTQESHWDSASSTWLLIKHGYDTSDPNSCVNNGPGNLTYTTDARNDSTVYFYDSNHLYITQMVQAYGTADARTFTFAHDFRSGLLTQKVDTDHGVTTNLGYDRYGRITSVQENGVRATNTTYDDSLREITVNSDLYHYEDKELAQTTYYDQLGRVRLTQDAAGNMVEHRYFIQPNSGASYELVSNPYLHLLGGESTMGWTRTTRDAVGRVTAVQHFSGATLPAPWDSNSTSTGTATTSYSANCTTNTDEAGVSRTSCTDGLGRMTGVTENGIGATTTYGYDVLDNLTSVTQGSTTRSFTYSSLKRLLTATNPESGTTSYTYDPNGNLVARLDARNITTTYAYDHLDEVTGKTYSDGTPSVSYAYTKSWLTRVQSSASTYNYTLPFDPIGRVTTATQITGGQSYTFNIQYLPTVGVLSIQYPNSGRTVTTGYDGGGRPNTLMGQIGANPPTNYVTATSYQPHGAIAQQTLGNGLVVSQCNGTACDNSRLQPTYISAGNLLTLSYGYSATQNNGNLLSQTIIRDTQTWTQNYSYDGANRLTAAAESNAGTWSQNLCYDPLGNRWMLSYSGLPAPTLETPQGANCSSPPYGSNNRITGWSYDAAGNVTTSGTGRVFTYDAENRQISATVNSQTTTYVYDGDGHRIQKNAPSGTTVYVYDPFGNLAQEYGTPTDTGTKYITADHLGSTRLETDYTGAVSKCYDYLPFGEEIGNGTGNRTSSCFGGSHYPSSPDVLSNKFASKERDAETGLDYFQTRYFSSAQGRYTSTDPLMASAKPSNPQTWNRYAYGLNNPLRFIDPDGMAEISVEDCQKDSKCTVVAVNVIMDKNANNGKGLTKDQMAQFNKVLQGAKSDLGNGNIALQVSYTSGEVTSSGVSGLNSSAANVFLSSYVPTSVTDNALVSGQLNGATVPDPRTGGDVMFISANNAQTAVLGGALGPGVPFFASFTNTLTHEFLHNLSGDTGRTNDNGFTTGLHEFQIDRQASGLHLDMNYIRPEQLQRAKSYSPPTHPDAVKPGK